MNLSNIYVVLSHPEESRNVGAACRAMANNGISHLRIVGKKEEIDDTKVRILAIHAASIWENAEFFDSVKEATADCVCSAGTTRRKGKKRKGKLLLPEEFAKYASEASTGKVAIVFGNERTGLTDEEIDECTMGVTIPSDDNFASLNLSHAVQILCYHMFREKNNKQTGYTPIALERLDKTVTSITDDLQQIGFFSKTGRKDMEKFWRDILSRSTLSEGEAQYLEKIFHKASGLANRNINKSSD
ncbi:MAG: RNA methyltransferase [Treponema sp.]|nr:RNA methyltransferase [Treponema sp.]